MAFCCRTAATRTSAATKWRPGHVAHDQAFESFFEFLHQQVGEHDQFGGLFADAKRMEERITGEIPQKVAADEKYQNAKKNSDRQNARIEHDQALQRVITALFKDDAQLFKQFQDNESFHGWLTDTVFRMTYEAGDGSQKTNA